MSDNGTGRDITVQRGIALLEGALNALKANDRYNTTDIQFKDYLLHDDQTMIDRVIEPLLRVKNSQDIGQAKDCLGYYALALAYFLGGSPKSKFTIQWEGKTNGMSDVSGNGSNPSPNGHSAL